jgi:hypothetical protein
VVSFLQVSTPKLCIHVSSLACSTCPTHLIPLDWMMLIASCAQYKSFAMSTLVRFCLCLVHWYDACVRRKWRML